MSREEEITVEVVAEPHKPSQKVSLRHGSEVGDLFGKMGLLREEYIAMIRGRVVTEFEPLRDGDRVNLIRIFSGG